jgi:hypothetical protein
MSVLVTGKLRKDTRTQALMTSMKFAPTPSLSPEIPIYRSTAHRASTTSPSPTIPSNSSLHMTRAYKRSVACTLSASKDDMLVYAEEAVHDSPWSYCDTQYNIVGQWYGEYNRSGLCIEGAWWGPMVWTWKFQRS